MKESLRWTLPLLLCALPLLAGPIGDSERDKLAAHFEMTRDAFLNEVQGLNGEQLAFRPNPESWSVFECAEHITIAEDNMYEEFGEKFLPLEHMPGVKSETPDEEILAYGTNRELQKSKAPETYRPTGRWASIEAALSHFRQGRVRNLSLVRTAPEDLRGRYLKEWKMDAYQYLLILSAHTQRHTKQIQEIKASAGFPK